MKNFMRFLGIAAIVCAASFALTSCEKKSETEKAIEQLGQDAEKAADKAGKDAEKALDKADKEAAKAINNLTK